MPSILFRIRVAFLPLFMTAGFPAAAQEPVVTGRICFMAPKESVKVNECREVSGTRIEIEPSDNMRRYAWLRSDLKQLVAGVVEAKATVVDLSTSPATIRFRLQGNRERGWPAAMELQYGQKEPEWKLTVNGETTSRLSEIRLPKGSFGLIFTADHHQPARRRGIKVETDPVDLGVITLQPRPRFSAVALRADRSPLGGAALVDDYGELLATADELGRVQYEAPCERTCDLPDRVAIEYPGLAGARILIGDAKRDFDAGPIVIGAGGTLLLKVLRPEGETFPIEVELVEAARQRDHRAPRLIAKKTIPEDGDDLRLEKLMAGKASLYLRGKEKTHVFSTYVTIEEEKETTEKIDINPTEVSIQVLKGGAAVPDSEVTIGVSHGYPDYDVTLARTDGRGITTANVWQKGTMTANARVGEVQALEFFETGSMMRRDVKIVIPTTVLRGRVFDADTGDALPNVSVQYQWKGETGESFRGFNTDHKGNYVMDGVRAGRHTITLNLSDYLPATAFVETTGGETERTLDLSLSRGHDHKLKIVWSDGRPVVDANLRRVIESGRQSQSWKSDGAGEVTIRMAKGSVIDLWIVPTEGSFAHVTIDGSSPSTTVKIPRPGGVLKVSTVDKDGKPAASSHIAVRYEGKLLDYGVAALITATQGSRLRTGSDATTILRGFPAGRYEFWGTQYDGDDLILGEPPDSPVTTVYYAGGDQAVTVETRHFNPRS